MKTTRFLTLVPMLIVVVFMFVFDSCELNIGGSPDCSASTSDVSEITDTSAKVGGVAYGASISTRGIVYGTQPNSLLCFQCRSP